MNTHWTSFLDEIDRACLAVGCRRPGDPPGSGREPWFRGHANVSFSLLPTLFRAYDHPDGDDKPDVLWVESELFYEFACRARELKESTMGDWDILFSMQHYGAPTRLLDWTEVLGVAVFFAMDQGTAPSPCVWVMNPYALCRASSGVDDLIEPRFLPKPGGTPDHWDYGMIVAQWQGMGWDPPLPLFPRQKSERMSAQCGWFTIHGNDHRPLEAVHGQDIIQQIPIPEEARDSANRFLEHGGINRRTLFPDMGNLAWHLKEQYGYASTTRGRRRPGIRRATP